MCKCLTYQFRSGFAANKFRLLLQAWLILPLDTEIVLEGGFVTSERPIRTFHISYCREKGISENKTDTKVRDGNRDISPEYLFEPLKSTCVWRLPDPQTYQLGDPACLTVWFEFLSFATQRVQAGFLFNTNHKDFQSAGRKVRMPNITWVSHNDTTVIANTARQGKQIERIREFKKKSIQITHTHTISGHKLNNNSEWLM